MSDDNVKVAVRLRPFTQREKSRNTELIISMSGKTTTIKNPDNRSETKTFTFDHSYWSHDGFKIQDDGVFVPDSPHSRYASQQTIYDDLGQGILDNALKGYACSLFAYGQTGSGKSYSIMGYGPNKGIVPIICEKLFTAIQSDSNQDKKYQITFAMLEIYNERLRDLLAFKSSATQELQLRQSPIQGFYVQGLTQVPVGSYGEIKQRMEQGMSNRTIAATNMNETSSRAHTVVTLTVDQFLNYADSQSRRRSIINLVDLAGSCRWKESGTVP
ncbi:unnamed protein product [Calicophoron daubneyi]|uniref:Kinesin motor domain-containing protein n=1 Tax=Calicophoron daubneyi TaxID=300641 RepID=A0AAV2TF94_CALDB